MTAYVYILASRRNGTLYVGSAFDLIKRVWQHREGVGSRFTAKYGVDKLVYFEVFDELSEALRRERRLKRYLRKWKIELIEKANPEWRDLFDEVAT